jgi:hypothetical protein
MTRWGAHRGGVVKEKRPEPVLSNEFLDHLERLGVIEKGGLIRRVIIDAAWNDVLTIYVEKLGDTRLLDDSALSVLMDAGLEIDLVRAK